MKSFCKFTVKSPAASYIPLPRFLLQDEQLRDISNDAKVLYALLLDRASVSRQNGYVEPDGTIRLYFTLEQAQNTHCRAGHGKGEREDTSQSPKMRAIYNRICQAKSVGV